MDDASERRRRAVRFVIWGVALASLGWWFFAGSTDFHVHGRDLIAVATLAIAGELAFVAGLVLVAIAAGRALFGAGGVARSLVRLRGEYRSILGDVSADPAYAYGLYLNWIGATVGVTGFAAIVGIVSTLPPSAWGLLAIPVADIVASFGLRYPLRPRRIRRPNFGVRLAELSDVSEIARVDCERYPDDLDEAVAMFKSRLSVALEWTWVLEIDGRVEGVICLQPTPKPPESFVSWEDSTDHGTLATTFDEDGDWLYIVCLTVSTKASDLGGHMSGALCAFASARAIEERKAGAYFVSRMPGYHRVAEYMSAKEYFHSGNDPQLRLYDNLGMKRVRLVEQAMSNDAESMNWGVLYQANALCHGWPFPWLWAHMFRRVARSPRLFEVVFRFAG